ncbi:hypothetical protein EJB05_36368, partial [Eragrostis curvula]
MVDLNVLFSVRDDDDSGSSMEDDDEGSSMDDSSYAEDYSDSSVEDDDSGSSVVDDVDAESSIVYLWRVVRMWRIIVAFQGFSSSYNVAFPFISFVVV